MLHFANDYSVLSEKTRAFVGRSFGPFINGRSAPTDTQYDLRDPSTGKVFAAVGEASATHVTEAVAAARAALEGSWSRFRPFQREACLLKLADLLEQNATLISEVETLCSGRLVSNTLGVDVGYSAHTLRYMAGWASKLYGKTMPLSVPYIPDGELDGFTFREPVGVIGAIVPWNVALGIAVWKVAPALAAGCTMVLKPAANTPLSALLLAQLAQEAGIPDGVLNILTGSAPELGAALVAAPGVDMVSFTGSTETGRLIAVEAARSFKRCSLELGGKSPVIVAEDADLSRAIPAAAWAIYANHGQNCCAGSRLYVHRSLFDRVVEGVSEIADTIVLGAPLDPRSAMGPVSSQAHRRRILDFVESGVAEGARVAAGGRAVDEDGAYVAPTLLVDVGPEMRVMREEIFGPVLVAAPFDTDAEALSLANRSDFGLGASIWSSNLHRVRRMTRGLQAGSVWVNVHNALDVGLPFGGWKNSGQGFDLGEEAVVAHTRVKSSVHHYPAEPVGSA